MFPREIYEIILKYADGLTLIRAQYVCMEWKSIVEYLEKKYNLWEECCKKELPKHVLYSMLDKCGYVNDMKWKIIFRNYLSWQNIKSKEIFVLPKQNIDYFENNITCAKISGSRIIYGNISGIVCVLNEKYEVEDVIMTDIRGTLKDIIFLNEVKSNENNGYNHTHAITCYEKCFEVLQLEPKIEHITMIQHVTHVSVYNNIVAYSLLNSTIKIAELNFNSSGSDILKEISSNHLHKSIKIHSLCLNEKIVVVISESLAFIFDYNLYPTNITRIKLSFPSKFIEKYWTFYNNIVFCTANSYLFFSTLNPTGNGIVTRSYNCMQILDSPICDILFYINILFLSVLNGCIYIYVVDDWSEFDLEKYDLKINVYGEPICSIDVQELLNEHRLILSMNDYITQVFIN